MTLLRAFLSVSGATFLSRLMGLWRDVVIAQAFGAGAIADAFFAAFRLPNTLRRFSAEGALSQAFAPVYGEERRRNGETAATLAGEITAWLAFLLLGLTALGGLFAPWVIAALAPGLEESATAADLFRIVFPYILFVSLVALFAGMLNAVGKFTAAAAAPLLLNAAMIAATLWAAPLFARPIFALAWGVFGGGVLQLLWLVWHVRRAGLWPKFTLPRRPSPAAMRIFRLLWRGALGAGAAQISLLINLFIASLLAAGSISWLYYADRLMELPVGLLGAALSTAALPGLAARANDAAAFSRLLDSALRLMLLLAAPAAVGLALLALPLVATLFMRGAFGPEDARMTQQATLAYSVGVIGLSATRPLAAAFFARQDAAAPALAALAALLATQCLNAVFVWGLGWGHVGLALSIGLGACLNAAALLFVLWRRGWLTPAPGWAAFSARLLVALAAMASLVALVAPPPAYWLQADGWSRVGALVGCVGAAVVVYFGVARLLGIRLGDFRRRL